MTSQDFLIVGLGLVNGYTFMCLLSVWKRWVQKTREYDHLKAICDLQCNRIDELMGMVENLRLR